MNGNVFVNEVRIPLEWVRKTDVIQYRSSGLSTGHKKRIEHQFSTQQNCIAIFEGDVLFCLDTVSDNFNDKKRKISEVLSEQVRTFKEDAIKVVKLGQTPERTIERLMFALVSFVAAHQGKFTIYGRTLFTPSKEGKSGNLAVETTTVTEDGFIKFYFTPTLIALINIQDTYREQRHDLELVGLCKFRHECALAKEDGSCPYVYPGRLGFYSQEIPVARLEKDRRQGFYEAYKECPQISTVDRVIIVKASRKATNTMAHPPFIVRARYSKTDLQTNSQIKKKYRDATLMWSGKRWEYTARYLKELFGDSNKMLSVGNLKIPIEVKFHQPIPINRTTGSDYRAISIPDQQIVNDKQNPQPSSLSGGWLFINGGAYDREDTARPFEKVHPYLIIPKIDGIPDLGRELLNIFSDGEYVARNLKGDQPFIGLNRSESKSKYNCGFVNVWDEEEGVFFVDGSEADYLKVAQDVERDWNKSDSRDLNRIVIAIIPDTSNDAEDNPLYYGMKKIFLEEGIPSSFITIPTLQSLKNENVAFGPILNSLWLNMYTKLGGKPWRLASQLQNVHCFIGVGFGLNPRQSENHIYAGVAHVFDKYGSWIDIASSSENLTPEARASFEGPEKYLQGRSSYKISTKITQEIVYDALRLYQHYQTKTKEPARNIVLHKLGPIYECEIIGFLEGIRQTLGSLNDCRLGILQIEQDHLVRLYGDAAKDQKKEDHTVFRSTGLIFNKTKIALATTGRISRRSKVYYPGIGTPTPLLLTSHVPSIDLLKRYGCNANQFYDIENLARHVMALTQLHWGSTKDNIRLPITTLYAQKVADLISKTGAKVDTWLSYHRPWFH